jgi:hypothetical protein
LALCRSFPQTWKTTLQNFAEYLSGNFAVREAIGFFKSPDAGEAAEDRAKSCRDAGRTQATNGCELAVIPLPVVYQRRDGRGKTVFCERVKNLSRKHGSNCVQNRRRFGQFPIN